MIYRLFRTNIRFLFLPVLLCSVLGSLSIPGGVANAADGDGAKKANETAKPEVVANPVRYERLADELIAVRLKLNDDQKSKIDVLIKQRIEALAKAAVADRAKISADSDKSLSAILTAQQRSEFFLLKPDPKLIFNFRFQKWADVLDWFAAQSDLSLVMDVPPPGTFNYSDDNSYSPTEAIDLLNGVLITKDFTLIRRGRMLLVIDIKDGLREGLVPRIELKELAERGKFELVSVLFPLGKRPAEEVSKEISPLLGPHGKAVALPKTKQILVTDRAGVMRSIHAIIESIAEPKAAAKPPAPKPPEKPILTVYSLKTTDSAATIAMLNTLVAGGKYVFDPKAEQLNANATPTQHAVIKKVLEKLQSRNASGNQPRLELYDIDPTEADSLLVNLRLIAPAAQFRVDSKMGKLVVWAIPADHQKLKTTMAKLVHGGTSPQTRGIEIYHLTKADPNTTLALLQRLFPSAKLSVDPQSRSLISFASPSDQRAIHATIGQLQSDKPHSGTLEVRFYPFKLPPPASLLAVIKSLAPRAQITPENNGLRLTILATAADHTVVKATIDQFLTAAGPLLPPVRNKLEIYPVTPAQRKRFQGILATVSAEIPGIRVITDAQPGELAIWAKPLQHKMIGEIISRLKRDVSKEDKYQLTAYAVKASDPNSVLGMLQTLFPGTQAVLDANTKRILVWTTPAEHEKIKSSLEKIVSGRTDDDKPRFESYAIQGATASTLLPTIQPLVPTARLSVDAKNGHLLAWGTPDEHSTILKAVEKLGHGNSPQATRQLEVYRLTKADPGTTLTLMSNLFPNARLSIDSSTKSLIAFAVPADQQAIRAALAELQPEDPAATQQLEVYRLTKAEPGATLTLMTNLFPNARLSIDSNTKSLIAFAVPADQQAIRAALAELQPGEPAPDAPELRFYPFSKPPSSGLSSVLSRLIPQAQITFDENGKRLMVVASPSDHKTVKITIERVQKSAVFEEKNNLVVYPITAAQHKRFQAILDSVTAQLPGIRVITDAQPGELSVWAKPSQHKVIGEIVASLKRDVPENEKYRLVAYPLKATDPANAMSILSELFPGVRIVLDNKTRRLLIFARPEDHQLIKESVDQLNSGITGDMLETFRVYSIKGTNPAIVVSLLGQLLPDVKMTPDNSARTIAVLGRKSDHATIEKTIKNMQVTEDPQFKRRLVVYPAGKGDPSARSSLIGSIVPEARNVFDSRTGNLAVWATEADHEKVVSAIKQISEQEGDGYTRELVVYSVKSVTAPQASSVLQMAVPEGRYSYGADMGKLIVWARPADHESIKRVITKLEAEKSVGDGRVIAVYPLNGASGSTLSQVLSPFQSKGAQIIVDTVRDSLIVRASEDQQANIARAIEEVTAKLPKNKRKIPKVYRLETADPHVAASVLSTMNPGISMAVDSRNRRVIVTALPEEHERIKAAVDEMEREGQGNEAPRIKSYRVNSINPSTLLGMLQSLFSLYPEVRLVADAQSGTIAALATPSQHAKIQTLIDEVGNTEDGATPKVYRFRNADPNAALTVLRSLTPNARMAIDTRNRSLVVNATTAEHKKIAATIKEMEREGEGVEAPLMKTYRVSSINPSALRGMLQNLFAGFPEVRLAADTQSGTVAAFATPAQHERIHTLIDELANAENGATPEVYRFLNADPHAALSVLRTLTPNARMGVDGRTRSLVVSATPEEHKKIAATIKKMDFDDIESISSSLRSYSLSKVNPPSALGALNTLFAQKLPPVRLSLDSTTGTIMAMATADQHKLIKTSIDEMELKSKGRTPQVYRFTTADPSAAQRVLNTLTPRAQVAVDQKSRSIVVSASEADHAIIKATVEKMEGNDADKAATRGIEVYSLNNSDSQSVLNIITKLMQNQLPLVDLSIEKRSNQLIAVAQPEQHAMIRKTIERLQTDGPELEVFQLEVVEAFTAEMAIGRLFGDDALDNNPNSPSIDSDPIAQQLYVRATPKQLKQIRDLLVKMGESSLNITSSGGRRNKIRVIHFQGDAKAAVAEIQRVWPKLRKNSIRVVTPSAVAPMLRHVGESPGTTKKDAGKSSKPSRGKSSSKKSSLKKSGKAEAQAQFSVPPEKREKKSGSKNPPKNSSDSHAKTKQAAGKPEAKKLSSEKKIVSDKAQKNAKPTKGEKMKDAPAAPVIISHGDGTITIASDDLEALDQMESLLRAMSRHDGSQRGRDYIVFSLKNSDARRVSTTLQQLFRSGSIGSRRSGRSRDSGRVLVVPDERLNAIVVHANRKDRNTIEELLTILDSAEIPESLLGNRPKLIPVKNTRASRVEEVLRDIYKSQLTRGGGQKPIPVPTGVSRQVAATIQQFNAASSGPLLTLGVDETTNSLIVMAPTTLTEEIEDLVVKLDLAAESDNSGRVTILQLKKINSRQVREALDLILQNGGRRRSRSRRRR